MNQWSVQQQFGVLGHMPPREPPAPLPSALAPLCVPSPPCAAAAAILHPRGNVGGSRAHMARAPWWPFPPQADSSRLI